VVLLSFNNNDLHFLKPHLYYKMRPFIISNLGLTLVLLLINIFVFSFAEETAGIRWHDLSVSTNRQILLHPFSFLVGNGQVCGIIGPSGSGKSTLLTALAGSSSLQVDGLVWLQDKNGIATTLSLQDGQVAYLQQHDAFFHMLTVRETLELAAYLEFSDTPKPSRDKLVQQTMDALGLAKVSHRAIGDRVHARGAGLSGGERRRLSVGLELLSTPQLFLADESTTGLDSSQAVKIVKLIADLARERQIPAILSLHQPRASIWKMLDSFILLAPGGRVCYAGPRQEALQYFRTLGYSCPAETNPAEFFIDLVSIDTEDVEEAQRDEHRIERLAHAFQESQSHGLLPAISRPPAPFIHHYSIIRRFGALLRRSWRQNYRNRQYNTARLIASIGSSLLFSQIFKSVRAAVPAARNIADRTALLSFGVVNMSMMALMKTVHLFSRERTVVNREQMRQQYSNLEYLLSKVFAEIPIDTVFAAVFTTVLKATTGLRISWQKLTTAFSVMTIAGASLGLAIGGNSRDDGDTAMAAALPIMVLFMVVGVINPSGVDKGSPPPLVVKILKQLSPIRWAIESLLVGEFRGLDLRAKHPKPWHRITDLPKIGAFVMVKNGDDVLDVLGLASSTFEGPIQQMLLLSAANLAISWFGLEMHNVPSNGQNGNGKQKTLKKSRDSNTKTQTLQVPLVSPKPR
jgi:ABC-type multidrug transport system ATPase subunit